MKTFNRFICLLTFLTASLFNSAQVASAASLLEYAFLCEGPPLKPVRVCDSSGCYMLDFEQEVCAPLSGCW